MFFCATLAKVPYQAFFWSTKSLSLRSRDNVFEMAINDAGKQTAIWDEERQDCATFEEVRSSVGSSRAITFPSRNPETGDESTYTLLVAPGNMGDCPVSTREQLEQQEVSELQAQCRALGLPDSGMRTNDAGCLSAKGPLIDRLLRGVPASSCMHLARFVRSASPEQQHRFFIELATQLIPRAQEERPTYVSTDGTEVYWLHVHVSYHCNNYHHEPYKVKPVCKFFNSRRGCRNGSKCRFQHGMLAFW